jgi:hypothetical protein
VWEESRQQEIGRCGCLSSFSSFLFLLSLFFSLSFSFLGRGHSGDTGSPLAKEEHLESDDVIQPTLPIRVLPMQIVLQSGS